LKEEILQISKRIHELREILDLSVEDIANKLQIDKGMYLQYENGEHDIPISALYEIANIMGVDVTVLLTGEGPRMNTYTLVRVGEGISVERYPGYNYRNLAYNFIGRKMEPMIVTIDPKEEATLVRHGGQEFNYVLEGKVQITIGSRIFVIDAGDSVYFDAKLPHAQKAIDKTAKFLTVIEE
jgi:transcriptional regulator with XRE-family HTH domain